MNIPYRKVLALTTMALSTLAGLASAQEIQGQKEVGSGASTLAKGINVSQSQLDKAGAQDKDWLHTNGNYAQTRFYPGKQINTGNVKNLYNYTIDTIPPRLGSGSVSGRGSQMPDRRGRAERLRASR